MVLQQIFIDNLKKFRNDRGLSQMRLAELCGTSTGYIGEIEIGYKFPSIEMVEKIAAALEVEPYLLYRKDDGVLPEPFVRRRLNSQEKNKLTLDLTKMVRIAIQNLLIYMLTPGGF